MADGGEALRGSVRFWPIKVGGHEELLLGPLAVQGSQRGRGIGIALMQAGHSGGSSRDRGAAFCWSVTSLITPRSVSRACRRAG